MVSTSQEGVEEVRHDPSCALHGTKVKADYQFELTIVLPPSPLASKENGTPSTIAIVLPVGSRELVRDLKNVVSESAEGFWLGAFSLARADEEEAAPMGDWDEIGTAFEAEQYSDPTHPRAIKVIDATVDEVEARTHVLRFREVMSGTSPAFTIRVGHRRTTYDPAAYAVDAGCSQYLALRGPLSSQTTAAATVEPEREVLKPLAITNGEEGDEPIEDDIVTPLPPSPPHKKRKGHGKSKSRARSMDVPHANGINGYKAIGAAPAEGPEPEAAPDPASAGPSYGSDPANPRSHIFEAWSQEGALVDPFDVIVDARSRGETSQPPLLHSISLSPYHPPPQQLRMRGHFLYLVVVTLEGARLHICATSRGYHVDRTSDSGGFNPAPRHNGLYHTSLLALLSFESSLFVRALQPRLEVLPPDAPDEVAVSLPSTCLPAVPWLVARPKVEADPLRPQLAYLATGQLHPDQSPPPLREWNEEFVTVREMPRKTTQERLNRDRLLARLQAEFAQAAAKGVVAIVRGELPPINPTEPRAQHTFVHNNLLLVSAEDPHELHTHMGGDEAVRVTTIKDLNGVRVLNALDLEGIHSIATCVIDFLGERWVVQGLLPGLLGPIKPEDTAPAAAAAEATGSESKEKIEEVLDAAEKGEAPTKGEASTKEEVKKDEGAKPDSGFKVIYGSSDTEQPVMGSYTVDPKTHEIAAKLAHHLHLCSHRVKDHNSDTTHEMWLPIEVKGIQGTDNRTYLIDLYRFQPVDIVWLERDLNGPLLHLDSQPAVNGDAPHANGVNGVNGHASGSESGNTTPRASTPPVPPEYPHHFTLLRPQLLDKFREDELRRYIQEHMSITRFGGGNDGEGTQEWQRIARDAQTAQRRRTSAANAEQRDVLDSVAAAGHSVFEMSSFEVLFHPDAYIERKDGPKLGAFDEDEKSVKLVRAVSMYLREFVLPDFVSDIGVIVTQPHDGAALTKMMHDRGIPMRYLGYLAVQCEKPPRGLPERHAPSARTPMRHLKALAMNEMVFRAAKHVFRRLIRGTPALEHAPLISHFLNCLVGDLVDCSPHPDLVGLASSTSRTWSNLTVPSLREFLCTEIATRYRFAMPSSFFSSPDFARPQLLRDIGLRCGVQLVLRKYDLRSSTSRPHQPAFEADDVINIVPVIHDAAHKTAWIDEQFEQGQSHFRMGQIGSGEHIVNEALGYYEQVYGTIHPELARHYHELAVLYHSIATPLMRNVNTFENGHALSASVDERIRSKKESGFTDRESCQVAKMEARGFFEQAVRFNRQSVIISERCFGLDSTETLQQYIDLAILEHANDRPQLALYYCRHALGILGLVSGPNHSDWSRILLNASQILQAWQGHKASVPLFLVCRDVTATARGMETFVTATVFSSVAAALANAGRLKESINVQKDAVQIFNARFGGDDERTKEAEATLDQLMKMAVRKEKGEQEKVLRLMRRMRTDENRAREIIARSKADAQGKSVDKAAANEVKEALSKPKAPSFAHLDIDEIVAIIEGGTASSSSASGPSNAAGKRRSMAAV